MQLEGEEADGEYFMVATLNKMFPFCVFPVRAKLTVELQIL